MDIYFASPEAEKFLERFNQYYGESFRGTHNSSKNMSLLERKNTILIDTIDTLIPRPIPEQALLLQTYGALEFALHQKPRKYATQFLKYHKQKKKGLHSDAFSTNELTHIKNTLHLDITKVFGKTYQATQFGNTKDFGKMITELHSTPEETIIIGDGKTDLIPAYAFNIDILLVPNYDDKKDFSYKTITPNE